VAARFDNGSGWNEPLDHLAECFFRNWPIRNKNCLWRPCLLTDQDKMCNRYREPSIDASYQVSIHLAKGFQRRRLKCEKLMDDGRQVMVKAHIRLARWANKGQTIINKTPHRKLKIEQHKPNKNPGVNPCELEGLAVSAPHTTPVV
jgi:hypothetical protein